MPSAEISHPPCCSAYDGNERRVGVEIEFAGVGCARVAEWIREMYGGTVVEVDPYAYRVEGGRYGTFTVKLDWRLAHLKAPFEGRGGAASRAVLELNEFAGKIGSLLAPYEVVTPPIPYRQLNEIDRITAALRDGDAHDTRVTWIHAMALQLNPDAPSLEPADILTLLQAYLLMSDYLRAQIGVDFTRRAYTYVDPFPKPYVRRVLAPEYKPGLEQLIDDYLDWNSTRNRELDLLPLFTFLDERRVRARLDDPRVRGRPTYHYRLPDSRISDPDWGVVVEWNRWIAVERLAADPVRIRTLAERFLRRGDGVDRLWSDEIADSLP